MGLGVGLLAAGAALSATAGIVGAIGQVEQAEAQAKAALLEQKQLESDQRLAEIQATQEETIRREQLRRALSASTALAGGSGVSVASRGFLNTQAETERLARRDIISGQLTSQARQSSFRLSIQGARNSQRTALRGGQLGAFGSVLQGFAGASSSGVRAASLFREQQAIE